MTADMTCCRCSPLICHYDYTQQTGIIIIISECGRVGDNYYYSRQDCYTRRTAYERISHCPNPHVTSSFVKMMGKILGAKIISEVKYVRLGMVSDTVLAT